MEQNKPNLDDWADFSGDYIKCDIVKEWPFIVVPIAVDGVVEDGKIKLYITIEYKGRSWKMGLNKTNQGVIRSAGLAPSAIVGKKLTFEKMKVRDPIKNTMVDGFILSKIE